MKNLMIAVLCALSLGANAQNNADTKGVLSRFIYYYNSNQLDSISSLLSERSKVLMPPVKLKEGLTRLHIQAGSIDTFFLTQTDEKFTHYEVKFSNLSLLLIMSVNSDKKLESFRFMPLNAQTKNKEIDTLNSDGEDFKCMTRNGAIHGTLTIPDGKTPCPVVLIIAGSGPTDRNGNNAMGVRTNGYRMLADTFRKAGIATLRYDKRGIGASAVSLNREDEVTFDTMVEDAVNLIHLLQQDKRFSKVIVAGHSEGSLIGILAAQRTKVSKLISFAGSGTPADLLMKKQVENGSKSDTVKRRFVELMDSIKKGYQLSNIEADYYELFRPSVQPYLKSWFAYDPSNEISKLAIPVLIVQGGKDIQVEVEEGKKLKNALPKATMIVYPTMDHTLKKGSSDPEKKMDTYYDPSYPLFPGMPSFVIRFIKS